MTVTNETRTIARERLQRTVPFTLERAAGDGDTTGDGLTLEGHAAVFNSPTLIDSWEGRFYEQIAKGAFRKTFRERVPVLQFDHGHHPLVGSIPIGRIEVVKEDDRGAYVKSRLHDNWLVQPVRDAIASESINGMSFRFTAIREEWRDPDGKLISDTQKLMEMMWGGEIIPTRTLKEISVPELGPVVFPAYTDTDVGVRSGTTVIDLGRLREDPAARKRLARALFMAESTEPGGGEEPEPATDREGTLPAPDGAEDPAPQEPERAAAPIELHLTITPDTTPDQAAEAVRSALVTARTPEGVHTEITASGPPAATGDHRPDSEPPDTTGAHRSDPAPAAEGHPGTDDHTPEGQSSTAAPGWAKDPRARKAHMAYVREMAKAATEKRGIHERSVLQYEAELRGNEDPDPGAPTTTSESGDS